MSLRALGIVKEIVETTGMSISHAHDDLVFMEHSAFLLQFTDQENTILVHINKQADSKVVNADIASLQTAAFEKGVKIDKGHLFKLSQADKENIRIEFY